MMNTHRRHLLRQAALSTAARLGRGARTLWFTGPQVLATV